MKRWPMLFWLVLLAVPMTGLAQDAAPIFESANCTFNMPRGFVIDCGYVTVPESRDAALADDTNTIRLAVAIFKSPSARPGADAVIYLDGGPGGRTLDSLEYFGPSFSAILEQRDVIFFDQRGVGLSGAIDCPAYHDLGYDILDDDLRFGEIIQMTNDTLLACREQHVANGINLAAYTSVESAHDVADIVRTLGYRQVNLLGISYGTRLGLTVIRDHPAMVRSAILDSVVPVQANPDSEFLPNAHRAFSTLFEGCAADTACDAQYPALESVFYDTVERLNAAPETHTVFDFYTGEERAVLMTGDTLLSGLFGLLYQTNEIPNLPEAIYDARDGIYDTFINDLLFTLYLNTTFDEGLFTTIGCNEEAPFDSVENAVSASDGLPDTLSQLVLQQIDGGFALCASWGNPAPDSIDNAPVVSDVPTLLLAGEYDPITPPRWARQAASTLGNSFVYELPGIGHSTFGTACAQEIILTFLNDPTQAPERDCVANLAPPLFATAEIAAVQLAPYTHDTLGFSAVVPDNWFEVEPGMFSPYPAMEQPIPVIAYRFPDTLDDYILRIITGGFYAYDSLPAPTDQLQVNGRIWTLYQIERPDQTVFTSFAFTESDVPYVIGVTATTPDERDYLYDALLIPAVRAFEISE